MSATESADTGSAWKKSYGAFLFHDRYGSFYCGTIRKYCVTKQATTKTSHPKKSKRAVKSHSHNILSVTSPVINNLATKMKIAKYVVSCVLTLAGVRAGDIEVCVNYREKGINTALSGVKVQCWDEDTPDSDDVMTGEVSTASNGCATLSYTNLNPVWYNPCAGWDCSPYQNPDIYCKVSKNSTITTIFTNTSEDHNQNNKLSIINTNSNPNFKTVLMFPNRVARGDPGFYNGCGAASLPSWVTDTATYITNFGDACNNHDLCYDACGETQFNCDFEFKLMMYSKCNDWHDTVSGKNYCKQVADGMFDIVRGDLGLQAYKCSQGDCPNSPYFGYTSGC